MLPPWIISLNDTAEPAIVGSKAHNLSRLHASGFEVPPALFLPTFDRDRLGFDSSDAYLDAIGAFAAGLNEALGSPDGWAVRSSATVEDLEEQSLAGRFDTHFITSPDELVGAVRQVWDSARLANVGVESMAVVVQKTIEADFGGVAFSRDPLDGTPSTVIEMCRGRGERLVDGEVTPWRVRMDSPERQVPAGFPPDALARIDEGVQRLAKIHGYATDVEWALKNGKLYWLQVRPVTTRVMPKFEVPESQRHELQGLWVRIRHCFAPQKPLVVSMNLPGLFDYPEWESRLVNEFHYVQMRPKPRFPLAEGDYERNMDRWDDVEAEYEKIFDDCLRADLRALDLDQLWSELQRRAELKRGFFPQYYDAEFHQLRSREYETVATFVEEAMGTNSSTDMVISELLGGLDTKTDQKQRQLVNLARLMAEHPDGDICASEEWQTFMDDFGYEAASTHLFYVPMLKENPELVLEMVRQNASQPGPAREGGANWEALRDEIEARLPAPRAAEFSRHLLRLRRCMKRTEDDDYLLQKSTAQVREALLELGRRLVDIGALDSRDDIFYLDADELERAVTQRDFDARVQADAIAERKRVFRAAKVLSPPALIVNGRPKNPRTRAEHGVLKGTPASPGIASGIAVVIDDPFSRNIDTLPANSVVIVPIVTPAFAYMLIGCAAIVTEIGGMASHGAIVAREMGIPAVVGIKGLREQLKSGMKVTVDGTRGEVVLPAPMQR